MEVTLSGIIQYARANHTNLQYQLTVHWRLETCRMIEEWAKRFSMFDISSGIKMSAHMSCNHNFPAYETKMSV